MPAVVSHYLLAERVFSSLKIYEPHHKLNHTAFLWGAYGPDIFFSHRIMPWQKQKSLSYIAKKMHNMDADKILNYLMAYAENNRDNTAKSYALGFVTHYAFDSTAHPFIIYFSDIMKEIKPDFHTSICHNDIESNLDTLFLKYETSKSINKFKIQQTSPIDSKVEKVIADMLHDFFLSFGLGNIDQKIIIQAQRDWHNSLVLLNDSTGAKRHIVKFGEKFLHIPPMLSPIMRTPYPDLSFDYANMKHRDWYKYNNEKHNENFFELVDLSEELSLKLILILLSGQKLSHSQCLSTFTGRCTSSQDDSL